MQTLSPASPEIGVRRFVIELLGFSEAERSMFASTFRLTDRRGYAYAEAGAVGARTDLYLVNADNAEALLALQQRQPNIYAPAVMIGRAENEAVWPQIDKPIHWMRLFEQMDKSIEEALLQRDLRKLGHKGKWDGRTYRRADDDEQMPAARSAPAPTDSVLVVDDSATVRAFMRAKLAPFHFDVDYAENGETAVEMALAKYYTCIFLDIMMPGIDGYQVCKRIKAEPSTKGMAVIMLSGKSSTFDKMRGSWAGCDAYLAKPVDEDELLTTIARYLPGTRKLLS